MSKLLKIPCSVGILTYNSGGSLEKTLRSVVNFAEIIVCDGGSIDDTLEMARSSGCKIICQDPKFKREDGRIKDFAGVRNQMLEITTNKWFFYVDSDELLSDALVDEVRKTTACNKQPTAFWVPRKYVVNGLVIDCASTYPSRQMRLFHLDGVNRFIKSIHERIEVKTDTPISQLQNVMLIPMTTDVSAIRRKWNYYIDLEEQRVGDVTLWWWIKSCFQNLKISMLYLFRFLRNSLFCKGNKMPVRLEMERHRYHINLSTRFFWRIRPVERYVIIAFLIIVATLTIFSFYYLATR